MFFIYPHKKNISRTNVVLLLKVHYEIKRQTRMAELLSMESKRNNEKQKALDSALAQIERQFGKGSIMKLGADNPVQEIEATSIS